VGLISTLFSPSKYGLIRDIGGDEEISFGTGTLEMFTFLGVLIGTFVASIVSDHYSLWLFAAILIVTSLIQLITSRLLGKVQESQIIELKNDTLNPFALLVQSFKWAKTIPNSNIIVLGLGTFWMIGNFILLNLTVHCDKVLHMTNTQTGIIMDISGLGIGIGSMLTGLWSKRKVQLGFTPIGTVGMMVCFSTLFVLKPTGAFFSTIIFLVSFFCGMYMVPLSSWVQHSVEGRLQGDMLAYSNFIIFLLIFISAGIFGPFVAFFGTNALWLVLLGIVLLMQAALLANVKEMGPKMLSLFKNY
jgi:acyl-[acyl-carrier-protein]-phospholipid O-acyltransferase/long-chain-fatty-acid--[acyl-carrier-protein] ligase